MEAQIVKGTADTSSRMSVFQPLPARSGATETRPLWPRPVAVLRRAARAPPRAGLVNPPRADAGAGHPARSAAVTEVQAAT